MVSLQVGDPVCHINNSSLIGTIISLEDETCKVLFDKEVKPQSYWCNRLQLITNNRCQESGLVIKR